MLFLDLIFKNIKFGYNKYNYDFYRLNLYCKKQNLFMKKLMFIGGTELLLMLFIIITFLAIIDISKSAFKDNSIKIVWSLIVLFLPIIGVLLYFMVGRSQKK